MKIGILTFHNVPNYGAALQAFALKTYLSKLGNEVSIIDYQCPGNDSGFIPALRKKNYINSNNPIKKIVKLLVYTFFANSTYSRKWKKFEAFSDRYFNKASGEKKFEGYDVVFCGSDQIWNPQITAGFKNVYFGLGNEGDCRVASYAASCGDVSEFDEEQRKRFLSLVGNLDFIGVREKSLFDFLKKENVDVNMTIDPTFLLNVDEYVREFSMKKTDEKRYLLQYSLQNDKKADAVAKKIAKEKGLKVVKVSGYLTPSAGDSGKFCVGPKEFLQYLYNAEYVVTNSFHGVALSLVFRKDFSVLLPGQRKGRVVDLLSELLLEDRIYSYGKPLVCEPINYNDVNCKLERMIDEARKFIVCVLESC